MMKKLLLFLIVHATMQAMDQSHLKNTQQTPTMAALVSSDHIVPLPAVNQSGSLHKSDKNKETPMHRKIEFSKSPSNCSSSNCPVSQNHLQTFFSYLATQQKAGKKIKLPTSRIKDDLEFFDSLISSKSTDDNKPLEVIQYSCNLCNQPFNSQLAYHKHANSCFARKTTNRQMHMMTKTISKRKSELLKKTDTALKALENKKRENSIPQPIVQS